MKRIDVPSAVNEQFVARDANAGQPGTQVSAEWLNNIQEEVCSVIEHNGGTLNGALQNQLLTAIQALAGIADGGVTTAKLADLAVTAAKIADGTIAFDKLEAALIASEAEAEAGTATNKLMTPERVAQAIAQLASSSNATESVSGSVELATIAEILSESATGGSGASLAITPATMKQHKGVAKAWAKFDGVSDAIDASFNVSSISDVGTGMYDINYIDDMSSPDYAISATCSVVSGQDGGTSDSSNRGYAGFMLVSRTTQPTASKCRIVHANGYFAPSYEPNDVYVTVFGDLANG